ncbi:MAG: hypothetical protein ACLGID_03380, partial [Gammaproteobacteria bacterium]
HFHTDHPVFSCSKIEQKQLNTWVSFQSAEQPLLGQFSVSGNKLVHLSPTFAPLNAQPHPWRLCLSKTWSGVLLGLAASRVWVRVWV